MWPEKGWPEKGSKMSEDMKNHWLYPGVYKSHQGLLYHPHDDPALDHDLWSKTRKYAEQRLFGEEERGKRGYRYDRMTLDEQEQFLRTRIAATEEQVEQARVALERVQKVLDDQQRMLDEVCSKRPVPCMWCGQGFPPETVDEHEEVCGA